LLPDSKNPGGFGLRQLIIEATQFLGKIIQAMLPNCFSYLLDLLQK
jgi:hypothetical protein